MEQARLSIIAKFLMRLRRTSLVLSLTVQICLLFTGCFRDPNVRKQEYVKAGDDYLSQGRYKEAKIYYGKAIQHVYLPTYPGGSGGNADLVEIAGQIPQATSESLRVASTWILHHSSRTCVPRNRKSQDSNT